MSEGDPVQQPVACSLRPGDLEDRTGAWRELCTGRLLGREWVDGGWVLRLTAAPGVAAAARELARLEAECCPWMDVEVTDGEVVTIRITSSRPGGSDAIRELFQAG